MALAAAHCSRKSPLKNIVSAVSVESQVAACCPSAEEVIGPAAFEMTSAGKAALKQGSAKQGAVYI